MRMILGIEYDSRDRKKWYNSSIEKNSGGDYEFFKYPTDIYRKNTACV